MAQRPDDGVTAEGQDPTNAADEDALRHALRKRRRLAEVFGDVLPDTTADERSGGSVRDDSDDDLRREVPPHHG